MTRERLNTSLTNGLKGPCSIFPSFFFDESSSRLWEGFFINSVGELPKDFFQNLEKSSITYLSKNDCRNLFFYKYNKAFQLTRVYINNESLGVQFSGDSLKDDRRILEEQFVALEKILNHHEENWPKDKTFSLLANGYINFMKALLSDGPLSRKLMAVSEYYFIQAEEEGPEEAKAHKHYQLIKVLLLIGRGHWEEATHKLHEIIKQDPNPLHIRILCSLYVKIGMPHVSTFLKRKYPKEKRISYFSATKSLAS